MSINPHSADILDGMPNIVCDDEALLMPEKKSSYLPFSDIDFAKVGASFGIILHMHQPAIPASYDDIRNAQIISNLQYMMEHQGVGDNHNASVFMWCYMRMAEIIPELISQGKSPRVMLDYSGDLLWGLRQMDGGRALETLRHITCDKRYHQHVEWVGTMWSHAVASSTPVPDLKLHMLAWRQHFSSIFGEEAVRRVKGFSPPEMHLPIHPDLCFEYVKALKECGYEWIAVQEHTIEDEDGAGIRRPNFPHRLVARNSLGETEEITVLIKTQGSDTKLVAQMQPYYEAKGLSRQEYAGKTIPPFVLQVGDGENGGVMMNEFPPCYKGAFQEIERTGTVALNGTEYLEFLKKEGVDKKQFVRVQPITQHRIWEHVKKFEPGASDKAIAIIHDKDPNFNLDRGSWTNDHNWVKGYEHVLDPINALSVAFHEKYNGKKIPRKARSYHAALLYLLLSQTSCFRYWGTGIWTEYAKEICRRGMEALGVQ